MTNVLLFKVGGLSFADSPISKLDKTILREVILILTRLEEKTKK